MWLYLHCEVKVGDLLDSLVVADSPWPPLDHSGEGIGGLEVAPALYPMWEDLRSIPGAYMVEEN